MENKPSARQPEAFARILIDRALSDSEWDLLDTQQIHFEFHTPTGRADSDSGARSTLFTGVTHKKVGHLQILAERPPTMDIFGGQA